ncbi:hypothetical protein HaLaN_10599 [Haematococcus lacustris]|uniref:Uncharacterized protein n=1 Tax=Haematococcus lacustris TaxID=44745 RepID=A0A699Z596_HAELA|nr:hypothetical protein HaLaN_10599 [Haematococcus lacustris]
MTFCFAAVLVGVRRGVRLTFPISQILWNGNGQWDGGHGWMDDVDSDDDIEVVIALGILPLLLAAILPLVADLAPPHLSQHRLNECQHITKHNSQVPMLCHANRPVLCQHALPLSYNGLWVGHVHPVQHSSALLPSLPDHLFVMATYIL